jgi:hypothetical protein
MEDKKFIDKVRKMGVLLAWRLASWTSLQEVTG